MKNFFFRKFARENDVVVAACDAEIAGKVFEDAVARLNVSKAFYCYKTCDESELIGIMRSSTVMNLTGNRCVAVAIRNGLVDEKSVLLIGGAMHAQAVTLQKRSL